jgi:peptidoglycan/LPS O-acetylase OafA/YrhL
MPVQQYHYFRGLNGLRFFAAFFVALSHASTFVNNVSGPAIYNTRNYSLFNNASTSVDFFFVLSGFLITSLLLNESDNTGNINIKHFYTRRALRIWPLYYFAIFIVYAIFPAITMVAGIQFPATGLAQFILYMVMLPNVAPFVQGGGLLSPLWSVGVEEQFYFLAAPLAKYRRSSLRNILISVIIVKTILNIIAARFLRESYHDLAYFILDLRFEVISIGCLGALLIRSVYEKYIRWSFNYAFQFYMLILLIIVLFFNKAIPEANIPFFSRLYIFLFGSEWSGIVTGCIFLYIILSVALNEKSIVKTNNKLLDTLGSISYGMYVYHVIVELAVLNIFKNYFQGSKSMYATGLYYIASIILTIAVSWCSYHLLEKRFLKLKYKFAPVSK